MNGGSGVSIGGSKILRVNPEAKFIFGPFWGSEESCAPTKTFRVTDLLRPFLVGAYNPFEQY